VNKDGIIGPNELKHDLLENVRVGEEDSMFLRFAGCPAIVGPGVGPTGDGAAAALAFDF
jgi:hypothetical protein